MSDLTGKTIMITGAKTGIGKATAQDLVRRGAHVILACRSAERTLPVVTELQASAGDPNKVEFLPLDLADLDSVRAAAERFLARDLPLHVLLANAGIAGIRGKTKSGFELAFGINHVGHALLINLLLDALKKSAPSRIVLVASKAHYRAKGVDYDGIHTSTSSTTGLPEYEVSKLANVLYAKALAKRLEGTGVTTYSLHPGVIASDIWRRVPRPFRWLIKLFMKSVEEGAKTSIYCVTDPGLSAETGLYYDECAPKKPSRVARDEAAADELWSRTADWIS